MGMLLIVYRMVGGIAQEIDARSDVLRIERELEEARSRLTAIRRAKYRGEGGDSDADGYLSGYDSSMETSGYRTNLNGSELRERSPAPPPPPPHHYVESQGTPESVSKVRQVYQAQQQQYQPPHQRSVSPVAPPKKQPPATPPRLSSVSTASPKTSQTESPLMILQRQRQLLESATHNVNSSTGSGIEDHTPSFSESRQRFNNASQNTTSSSTFNTSVSTFHSPQQVQGAYAADGSGSSSFYSSTVRSTEQVQHTQRMTTQRTEKISMSSTSKVYQVPEK